MIWWASQPSRARSERAAIAELEEQSDWLRNVTWRLSDEGRLCADFELEQSGEFIALMIVYPSFFPNVPPLVKPHDTVRLSDHQYGTGGELCLEYRPDNWEPAFTGAMMIESARRLLTGEGGPGDAPIDLPDAHDTTLGQDVRSAKLRFVLSQAVSRSLLEAPLCAAIDIVIVEHSVAGRWLAHLLSAGEAQEYWDAGKALPKWRKRSGFFVRLPPSLAHLVDANYDLIEALVGLVKRPDLEERLASSTNELVLIVECSGTFKMMSLSSGAGKRHVHDYKTVIAPARGERLPHQYDRLRGASVAIIGCGSVGSKVAASLARAGVGRFLMVDGDVFFDGNVVRNDLDWRAVGLNKPDAVKARLADINPEIEVTTYRVDLGGQESAALAEAILIAVGKCDIVVDATADPQVFNILASLVRNERKTLVWGEVYAGGIGGLVARLRPDYEPVPHAARKQIAQWCADQGVEPPHGKAGQYGLQLPDGGPPLVADDADVAVIAAHMSRLVLDALTREETAFAQAAYLIGLQAAWIFAAPFDTWPITLTKEGTWGPEADEDLVGQLEAFTAEFFPNVETDESA